MSEWSAREREREREREWGKIRYWNLIFKPSSVISIFQMLFLYFTNSITKKIKSKNQILCNSIRRTKKEWNGIETFFTEEYSLSDCNVVFVEKTKKMMNKILKFWNVSGCCFTFWQLENKQQQQQQWSVNHFQCSFVCLFPHKKIVDLFLLFSTEKKLFILSAVDETKIYNQNNLFRSVFISLMTIKFKQNKTTTKNGNSQHHFDQKTETIFLKKEWKQKQNKDITVVVVVISRLFSINICE